MFDNLVNIIGFVLLLSFLVIIHELGHFITARLVKIKVEEFGLGYPPRAIKLFKKWGTVFSLNWVPFGGFVRMDGEDGVSQVPEAEITSTKSLNTAKNKVVAAITNSDIGPFYSKSKAARLLVILAGASVNFVFGILAFAVAFSFLGIPGGARVENVQQGTPAERAGVQAGSVIVAAEVEGERTVIKGGNQLAQFTSSHPGKTVTIFVTKLCETQICDLDATPVIVELRSLEEVVALEKATNEDQGILGINQSDYSIFYPWYEMPIRGSIVGVEQALLLSQAVVQALGQMMSNLVFQGQIPAELSGPIGIGQEVQRNKIFQQPVPVILLFAGIISVNLAIMNILPIPALDGGRALFILIEGVVGRKRMEKVEGYANYGGFVVLLGLIMLISARDIYRLFI